MNHSISLKKKRSICSISRSHTIIISFLGFSHSEFTLRCSRQDLKREKSLTAQTTKMCCIANGHILCRESSKKLLIFLIFPSRISKIFFIFHGLFAGVHSSHNTQQFHSFDSTRLPSLKFFAVDFLYNYASSYIAEFSN